ncbi:tyrosine-type recombinase/integrase [Micromonospora saelicesensis]|uniref:tyrosine-type recombinase/integrase n=1 Tax=Micromonospora saelicesensis TaxID=285676 RepID=UPI0021AD3D0F|nr:tyrosine-type recombinase/integrase [Micromonospora saelicesensis]
MWRTWRNAASWPDEGTFHSRRHYFVTRLITSGADPTEAQNALRHSSLRITLETSVTGGRRKTATATSAAGLYATRAPNENGARRPRILADLCRTCARRSCWRDSPQVVRVAGGAEGI